MSQFESVFQNILNSVKFGSASFSNTGQMTAENAIPGNDTQIMENDTAIASSSLQNLTMDTSGQTPMMENITAPVAQDSTIMVGKSTGASTGASVTIAAGSKDPDNGKFFEPETLTVSRGSSISWINDDSVVHTVTSGKPNSKNAGAEFDSSYVDVGQTFQHTFDTDGTFPYYCTLHPFMKGKIIVS
jgi:plastocyanin